MKRRSTLLLGLAVVTTSIAACGDDDPSPSAPTPAPPATSSGVADPTTPATPASDSPDASEASDLPAATTPANTAPATTTPATTGGPGTGSEPAVTFTEVAKLVSVVDLAWRAGDDGLYVVEQAGRVERVGADGEITTVLDVTDLTEAEGEQGLLGLAFDPAGELAYINYTNNAGTTTIGEYPVDADGTFRTGDEARIVLEIEQPYPNHNGGDLAFGPDGMLYIGMGDGGSGDDPERRATDMSSLLGKMLRIDPAPSDGRPYTVPADNPFVGEPGVAPEIWSSGLRNPWRFSFDRQTGDLWIGDVGQGAIEEIDVAPATNGVDAGRGLSFGWSAFEGDERLNEDVPATGHTPPFSTYDHSGGRCSVSGGVRVRGGSVPELLGWYVYGDYCSGEIWAVEVIGEGPSMTPGRVVLLDQRSAITGLADGPDGEVYVVSSTGEVVRLDPA